MMNENLALAVENGCSVPFSFLQIDLKKLPELWWLVLKSSANDYLQFDEYDQNYRNAFRWLFCEEFDPVLDGKKMDVVSFHVIAAGLNVNIDKLRFEIQRLKDIGKLTLGEEEFSDLLQRCEIRGLEGRLPEMGESGVTLRFVGDERTECDYCGIEKAESMPLCRLKTSHKASWQQSLFLCESCRIRLQGFWGYP